MADWAADDTSVYENVQTNGHSRRSSSSSGRSADERRVTGGRADDISDRTSVGSGVSASSTDKAILLTGGRELTEESITDTRNGIRTNGSVVDSGPQIPPKDSIKMKKPAPGVPSITTTAPVDTIHEDELTIPNDGCLYNFTADEISTFFRYMHVDDRLISHMHRKGVDGKRFSRLKDSEMESIGINNPVIKFFRDKSVKKAKGRMPFLL